MEKKSLDNGKGNEPRCWNGNEGWFFVVERLWHWFFDGEASITEKGCRTAPDLPEKNQKGLKVLNILNKGMKIKPYFTLPRRTKKQRKRDTIRDNRERGEMAERIFVATHSLSGEVTRTGRGHDFKVKERNPITGRTKTTYHEVKSSRTAPLSKLQKKKKKKMGSKYRVERPWF